MKVSKLFKYFSKNSEEHEELKEIASQLPENEKVTKDILSILDNTTTKVVLDNDIKSSYYVYLNDTIYLSDLDKNKKGHHRICLIAHECIHSMQSKTMQKINFIISNIELVMFFAILILTFIFKDISGILVASYILVSVISMVPRLILEIGAIKGSLGLSKKYLVNMLNPKDLDKLINSYKHELKVMTPIALVLLFIGKYIRAIILIIIKIFVI